jgi:hypothetical protein
VDDHGVALRKLLCAKRFAVLELEEGGGSEDLRLNRNRVVEKLAHKALARLRPILRIVGHLGRQCRFGPSDFALQRRTDPNDVERSQSACGRIQSWDEVFKNIARRIAVGGDAALPSTISYTRFSKTPIGAMVKGPTIEGAFTTP